MLSMFNKTTRRRGWGATRHRQPSTNRGYGNVHVAVSIYREELVLLAYLGHSSYRVMVLYAFVGPRGPGVSIAARRTPQE